MRIARKKPRRSCIGFEGRKVEKLKVEKLALNLQLATFKLVTLKQDS